MGIEEYRSDFMIFVVDDEESIREILKEALSTAGYQVETFPTAEDGFARVKESPPHLIFSDIRMPGMSGIQLLEKVKEESREIEFIIMTSHASLETAVNAIKLGAYDYIFKPFENLSDVVTTADRTIERVYMKLENEQLLEELAEKNALLASVNQRISQENQEIQIINAFMQKLSKSLDPDHVLQMLLDAIAQTINNRPAVFLRYLPQHKSLVCTQASVIPLEQLKGIGLNLATLDQTKMGNFLLDPMNLPGFATFMKEVFRVEAFQAFSFLLQNQPLGIIAVFDPLQNEAVKRLVESFVQITRVSFENASMTRRIHEMAIKDPLTGLYNRRHFNEKLDEEMTRSRRTRYPISLIYLDIDNFKKYNDQNGHPEGDILIKSVAQILVQTSRKSDLVARLGGEEFAIICPHTAGQGAAIKAEKVRLVLENTKFPHGEKQPLGKVSASFGVSEYPSVVNDAESLIRAADDALYKVKTGGRNRVCLADPPQGFKPEFEPLIVPSAGPPALKT